MLLVKSGWCIASATLRHSFKSLFSLSFLPFFYEFKFFFLIPKLHGTDEVQAYLNLLHFTSLCFRDVMFFIN